MNAVDTSVLIYRLDRSEPAKRERARKLLTTLTESSTPTVLLYQVVGELMSQLRRWQSLGRATPAGVVAYIEAFRSLFPIALPTVGVFDRALQLSADHALSHWDAMLIGACCEAGVDTLFTEDMGSPRRIESVELVNPFV